MISYQQNFKIRMGSQSFIFSKDQTVLADLVTAAAFQFNAYIVILPFVCEGVNECLVDDSCARWQWSL
jgi:hypothetical protein